ncbi:MAG: flavohemoglobin expression-modulating QEGLA motif protein [Rhodospirillaceae bacterium]|nr:flavohemoglobin expression-modulating QEGLA motif protein [Rhodospirillaceae bacterium]
MDGTPGTGGDGARAEAERLSPGELERLKTAAALLRKAEKPVRILRAVGWGPEVEERFMAQGAKELPQVAYTPLDPKPVHAALADIRPLIAGSSPAHAWLWRVADTVATAAEMLAGIGTKDFHRHSLALYGSPQTPLVNCDVRPLDLARTLDYVLSAYTNLEINLNAADPAGVTAADMQPRMQAILDRHFGADAPKVEIAEHLSAKALAGSKYIRLKRTARFSDRDLSQLVHHEAFVHAGTSFNGAAQTAFPILAAGHAGTTRTQEGLAVFAELISGAMDPSRMLRLADRVIAIQMAMDGADFIQLYQFFLQRHDDPHAAFENARRVVRGGMVAGGAPFTKDSVYLEGVIRVHNFLRIAVQETRVDCIRLLFAGKLDIEDMPAITQLAAHGLIAFPKFLPPWAKDLRFVLSYIAYSSFLNRMQLDRVRAHYIDMLRACAAPPANTGANGGG